MSFITDHAYYIKELAEEIIALKNSTTITDEQKNFILIADEQIQNAQKAKSLIEMWSCINSARAQRAYYIPDDQLLALVIYEQKRAKDFLDDSTRDVWQIELDKMVEKISTTSDTKIRLDVRHLLSKYLQLVGRRWNSLNVRDELRIQSWMLLSIISGLGLLLAIITLWSADILTCALFGGLGGVLSSIVDIPDLVMQFRNRRQSVFPLIVRPLIGALVAIVLLQFLISGISPIQVYPLWDSTNKMAWIASIAFAGGFSGRFVLGKLTL